MSEVRVLMVIRVRMVLVMVTHIRVVISVLGGEVRMIATSKVGVWIIASFGRKVGMIVTFKWGVVRTMSAPKGWNVGG